MTWRHGDDVNHAYRPIVVMHEDELHWNVKCGQVGCERVISVAKRWRDPDGTQHFRTEPVPMRCISHPPSRLCEFISDAELDDDIDAKPSCGRQAVATCRQDGKRFCAEHADEHEQLWGGVPIIVRDGAT